MHLSYLCLHSTLSHLSSSFFFFNHTATTEIYTLSLHDALPISWIVIAFTRNRSDDLGKQIRFVRSAQAQETDRKSTRLNSSHGYISYAVFCLKKKKKKTKEIK